MTFQAQENESMLDDMLPVTVVFDAGFARSPALEPGDRWTVELLEPGLYDYHLDEHRAVEGTIVVE